MPNSILFFQASATIIPTLFIALAFTSRALAAGETSLFGGKSDSQFERYGISISLLGLAISGEAVALATLAANHPTFLAEYWVLIGIAIMLGYLLVSVTAPFRKSWRHHLGLTLFLGTFMPILVFISVAGILGD